MRSCLTLGVNVTVFRDALLIDGLHKLANDQRDALNPLDLFLSPYKLALQTPVSGLAPESSQRDGDCRVSMQRTFAHP